jgi:threonine/homoserine/homoserine lactone efflux protein
MIWEFILAALLIELTPGPNMVYLAALSAQRGRRAGLLAIFGITLGLSMYLLLAVLGLGAALATKPTALSVLKWSGVAYLFYLAWEAWNPKAEASPVPITDLSPNHPIMRGFLANVLNVKAAIFYVALLPRFIFEAGPPFWLQVLGLGAIHLTIATAIHTGIVLAASRAHGLAVKAKNSSTIRGGFALAIAATALWLALT